MSKTERRSARRFQVQLPLMVRWVSGSAIGEAVTESKDVSSGGASFSLPKDIKNDSPIEIVTTLPHEITLVGSVKVCCLGRVRWIQSQPGQRVGVAVAIEHYEFSCGGEDVA